MKRHDKDIAFEDALSDDWQRDLDVAEVAIGNQSMRYFAIVVAYGRRGCRGADHLSRFE